MTKTGTRQSKRARQPSADARDLALQQSPASSEPSEDRFSVRSGSPTLSENISCLDDFNSGDEGGPDTTPVRYVPGFFVMCKKYGSREDLY